MKKISLLTMAVAGMALSVSAAQAKTNLEDPTYMPENGMTYSKTALGFGAMYDKETDAVLTQEFGMGISDSMALRIYTGYSWGDDDINDYGMSDIGIGMTWRMMKDEAWTLDFKGDYVADTSDKLSLSDVAASYDEMDDDRISAAVELGHNYMDWTWAVEAGYNWFLDSSMDDANEAFYAAEAQWRFSENMSANVRYDYSDNSDAPVLEKDRWTFQLNNHLSNDMVAGVYYSYDDGANDLSGAEDQVVGLKFAAQW
ncbi:MAG: hypothetical protein N4A44_01595 [Alphaproteobacteria bacterium]|nr:hypothetical protein [Alphaproteobacteria bacterium]